MSWCGDTDSDRENRSFLCCVFRGVGITYKDMRKQLRFVLYQHRYNYSISFLEPHQRLWKEEGKDKDRHIAKISSFFTVMLFVAL